MRIPAALRRFAGRPLVTLLALVSAPSIALTTVGAQAQAQAGSVAIHVRETGGIRRSAFPVTARVPFARGVLADGAPTRLLLDGADVPSQSTTTGRWPDGSVQWLDVDFNASPGPGATLAFALQYGAGVSAAAPGRGLAVTEEAGAIQVGNVRFNRSASPLVASVKYREEAIGTGPNGLIVTDAAGGVHDLSSAADVSVEIVKRGPLVVVLKYAGAIVLDPNTRLPFTLTAEMPSSKSWFKLSAVVDDPAMRVRDVALATPLALGAFPWVWDFGTTRWTYGQIRSAAESAAFAQSRTAAGAEWTATAGPKGRELVTESSAPEGAAFAGWGHVQGVREVVAFAIDGLQGFLGSSRISIDGAGQLSIRLAPASPRSRHELTVYEHFVSTPVQIGAATSPAAILTPLAAVCDAAQYETAGVAVPPGVR